MSTRNELNLFLGIRFHEAGNGTLEAVETLLEDVASLEAGMRIPLVWNTPLFPLFSGSGRRLHDLITEIKARVRSRGDIIAPQGFRGALHPLLDRHELAKELSWCRRNPWLPGFRELFGQEPDIAIPLAPDLIREEAAATYSAAGFHTLGLPVRLCGGDERARVHRRRERARVAGIPGRFLLYRREERAAVVTASLFQAGALADRALALLAAVQPGTLLLLLDLAEGRVPDSTGGAWPYRAGMSQAGLSWGTDRPVSRLIDALARRHSVVPGSLSRQTIDRLTLQHPAPQGSGPPSGPRRVLGAASRAQPLSALLHASDACGVLELETGILGGRRLARAREFRRPARRRNEDTCKALEVLAGVATANPESAHTARSAGATGRGAASPRASRAAIAAERTGIGHVLFAEMGGAVSLPGPEFAARFGDGRFHGLSRRGREILSGQPAESWFVFEGARCDLRTISAASFERDGDQGLATTLTAELPRRAVELPPRAVELPPRAVELRLLVEAYFREGYPELHLSCTVRFPKGCPALQSAAPYEIPLFRFGDRQSVRLETELEEGVRQAEDIPPGEQQLLACGRRFRLSLEGVSVMLETAAPATVLPLRVRRESGRWALRACLGGYTCPHAPVQVAGMAGAMLWRIAIRDP